MPHKKTIVVVLGMHRSGTSLTANFLHEIGVDFGEDLTAGDESNEAGYWESQTIRLIHKQILARLNCQWHNPPLFFPPDWQHNPEIRKLRGELLRFVRSQCEKTEKVWGFKDPRTAVLLPMWQEIFDELQLEPYYVLAVRHPAPVAASLSKRDDLSFSHSQLLWLKSNLGMLLHTENKLRATVDYDCWFDSATEQARRLIDFLGFSGFVNETRVAQALSRVVHQGLRHHQGTKEAKCTPMVERLYSLLPKAASGEKNPEEALGIVAALEASRGLLHILDETVRDRDTTIERRRIEIKRLKKQRNIIFFVGISIIAISSWINFFLLAGGRNWFR